MIVLGAGVPLIRALTSFIRASPSWPKHVPKIPPSSTITLGVKMSTYELEEGHKYSDYSTARTKTDDYFIFKKGILIPKMGKMSSQNDRPSQERIFRKYVNIS